MEYTILGCDLCPKRPRPRDAVTSRTLVNGKPRKGDPSLDLCAKHARVIERSFRPTAAKEPREPRRGREAAQAAVQAAEKKVLAALAKGPMRLGTLGKATRLSKFYVHKATVTLRAAKKIEKVRGSRKGFQLVGRKNGG